MGSVNQLLFIRKWADRLEGPFLEVGAKDYGTTQDLRSIFADRAPYVGVDLEQGEGVDVVLDLAGDFRTIETELGKVRFGTIFCLSVLEHCRRPFAMAENLSRLLKPGGRICVSAPFAFKFHAYPCDYWRFTHEGIRQLFSRIEFRLEDGACASSRPGEFEPLDTHVGRRDFTSRSHWRRGRYLRGISAGLLRLAARIGVLHWLAGYPYVLAPTDILMIGARREAEPPGVSETTPAGS